MVKTDMASLIIIITVAVFFLQIYYFNQYGENFLDYLFTNFGFTPQNLFQGQWWTLVTSIFLHATPQHIILNMLALFFFGSIVEKELGPKKFLLIYLVSGVLGNLIIVAGTYLGLGSATIPTIGASGAVFGIMGTAMIIKPLEFVFYPYIVPIPLIIVAFLYTIVNLVSFIYILSTGTASDISYISHIGGLLSGIYFGYIEKGISRSFLILLAFLLLFLLVPFILLLLPYISIFNYVDILSKIFK